MKLYKKLPILYLITFPFYMFAGMLMVSLTGVAVYLLEFWFNPVFIILKFINTIIQLPFPLRKIAVNIAGVFISNLIFWFLVGLLIDKLFNRVKNGK